MAALFAWDKCWRWFRWWFLNNWWVEWRRCDSHWCVVVHVCACVHPVSDVCCPLHTRISVTY